MNLPNRITLFRIFLVPAFVVFLSIDFNFGGIVVEDKIITYSEIIATIIFVLAAATDGIDGYVARSRNLVTNLGKFLDPLADKLLVTGALICLVEIERLPAWIAIVIISREFAVTGLRLVAAANGTVIAASKLGKLKTATQILAIILLLLNNFPFIYTGIAVDQIIMWAALLITIISGLEYFIKNWHAMENT